MGPRSYSRGARVACTVLLGALGCNDALGTVCTAEAVFGLQLTVLDGSGAPAAEGALGTAVDDDYSETLMVLDDDEMVGAVERAGTYDVAVSKPGYADWSAENVTVTEDECHVIPVHLEAILIPVP